MPDIVSVDDDPARIVAAQRMFREYCEFLRESVSCGTDCHNLDKEIAALPAPYTAKNGELLLAYLDGEDEPAACIAHRRNADDASGLTCEIKRLYVRAGFRGHGLARTLVAEAIACASARGYARAILDTDVTTMPAAFALYRSFGFREYADRDGNLAYLELRLGDTPTPALSM